MELPERDAIRKNSATLIELTNCSTTFLSIFLSKGIFSKEDVEIIQTTKDENGSMAGCKIFYKLLETRVDSFKVLVEALEETNQTLASAVLHNFTSVYLSIHNQTQKNEVSMPSDLPVESITSVSIEETNEYEASNSTTKAVAVIPSYEASVNPRTNTTPTEQIISSASNQTEENKIPMHFDSPPNNHTSTAATQIKYNKNDILGEGSGGTNVYKGTFGQREVAVKVISHFKDQTEAENETRILLKCDKHQNIVRYFHSEMAPDGFLMALELCEKSTLADWVDDPNCISIEIKPLEVLRQATQGLGYLHQPKINITHRDLKPSNILFLMQGSDVVVKISDFGISRIIEQGRNTRTVTRFGGTSGWTAAEVLEAETLRKKTRRSESLNIPKMVTKKKSDIFSLGCIFYFVLTNGEHPFGDNDRLRDHNIETDQNILDVVNVRKYHLRLQCNLSLIKIMIAKDPKVRPDVEYILAHPIFWSHTKMIDFIDAVSNFVTNPIPANKKLCDDCKEKLETNFKDILESSEDGWFDLLDKDLKDIFLKRYPAEDKKLATALLRKIRNCKHHYNEKNYVEIKKQIGEMPNSFMEYWLKRFPSLINKVRDASENFKALESFKEYF